MLSLINHSLSNFIYICSVLFLTTIFYGVKLSFLPLDFYRFFYLLAFFLFCFYLKRIHLSTQWCWLILVSFFALFVSLLISIYTKSNELVFIRMNVDYFLTFLISIPVLCLILKRFNSDVLLLIIHMVFLQSIVMFLMVAFPPFQKFILSLIDTNGIERTEGLFRFRGVGLTGLATYSMGVTQSFGLFLFHLYWKRQISKLKFLFSTLMFVSILLSAVLSARTSFLFVILLLFSYFIIFVFSNNMLLKKRLTFVFYFMISSIGLIFLLLSSIDSPVIEKMLSWVGEIFISLLSKGSVSTVSTDAMKGLFFMPQEYTVFFGDGQYLSSTGKYYMSTDIGYLRVLLYGGLLGSISFYLVFLILFYILIVNISRVYGFLFALPLVFYFFCVFIVNVKGSIFFDGFTVFKLIALVTYYFERFLSFDKGFNQQGR